MGCIFGKDEPAAPRKDRTRINSSPVPARRAPSVDPLRTPAQSIQAKRSSRVTNEGAEFLLSKSPTDRRDAEFDEIRNIVEHTQHNFIDIGQKVTTLDEKDVEDRSRRYREQLAKTVSSAPLSAASLYLLPPSLLEHTGTTSLIEALTNASQPLSDTFREWMINGTSNVAASLDMRITDVGHVVIPVDAL